MGNFPTQSN